MPEEIVSASIISLLDEHTANRIAAGEVVERPASVVKELVENAIDAGSTAISVTLEDGGKELIKITDNGCGMTREDAVLSLQRHATSKIRDADDLESISTLGFRGEALPSIASVSFFEVISRHQTSDQATRLEVEAGTIVNLESVGAPQGTTMSVRRLFFNTPARLKFMKTAQTEMGHISEIIGQFAMAYPHISFRLTHGGREVLLSPATSSRLNAITAIMGRDVAKHLAPVSYQMPEPSPGRGGDGQEADTPSPGRGGQGWGQPVMKIEGFISTPALTRINRRDQVFFVNGRPIKNRTVNHAVDEAYRGLMQPGRYPVVVLFIEMQPDIVDVNVHPTKAEVKFSSEQEVHRLVHRAVNQTLLAGAAAPTITDTASKPTPDLRLRPDEPEGRQIRLIPELQGDPQAFSEALAARRSEYLRQGDAIVTTEGEVYRQGEGVHMEESPVTEADVESARTVALRNISVIGQARNTYIIAQCEDGVLVIDQHVAHERVLFEGMLRSREEQGTAIQGLVIPLTLSLSAREAAVVTQRIEDIRKSGFDIDGFGGNTFMVRGAPGALKPGVAEATLREMIQELVDMSIARHLVVRPDQVLITASCKMAVKAGESLTMPEMTRLVEDLMKCENPFVCPHGRPIVISLSNWELDRKFHRV